MLTTNFAKMIFIFGGNQTAKNTLGENATMYAINNSESERARTIVYGPAESTRLFTDETIAPDTRTQSWTTEQITYYNAFYAYSSTRSGYNNNTLAMLVGTGTTPPTADDYKLESQCVLDWGRDFCYLNTNGYTITLCRVFINNTENPVDIKEMGAYLISGTSGNTPVVNAFLIGRQLLTETVTIPVGGSHVFTYCIDMSNSITEEPNAN